MQNFRYRKYLKISAGKVKLNQNNSNRGLPVLTKVQKNLCSDILINLCEIDKVFSEMTKLN